MPRYDVSLTTLNSVIRQIEKADPTTGATALASYDEFKTLLTVDIIPMISSYIMHYCDRSFVPYCDTKDYYLNELDVHGARSGRLRDLTLILDEDLILTGSVSWNGTALPATAFRELNPRTPPYYGIRFNPEDSNVKLFSLSFDDKISIEGRWGYAIDWNNSFTPIEAITVADATTTEISVSNIALYDVLSYVRVESELMQITRTYDHKIVVRRGVNGSTPTAHTAAMLSLYRVVPDVRQAATRLAAWAYQHRSDLGDRINFSDGSSVITEVPSFVKETLNKLKRVRPLFGAIG
jgi:hypothetical protein